MQWVNPLPGLKVERLGMFDFPVIPLPEEFCKWYVPNVDPGTPLVERLHGKLGTPPEEQGLPRLREKPSHGEDPEKGLDTIIHLDQPAIASHIGRLSGSMIHDLADQEHTVKVTFHAAPVLGGEAIQLCDPIVFDLEPDELPENPPDAQGGYGWAFWRPGDEYKELILLAVANFTPNLKGMIDDGTYRLVVGWNIYHNISPDACECEPFAGFDDSISFHITTSAPQLGGVIPLKRATAKSMSRSGR